MKTTKPCMGGFCSSRDRCENYYAVGDTPSERLCGRDERPAMTERPPAGSVFPSRVYWRPVA